jgi:exodeoxyribonuclease VIII
VCDLKTAVSASPYEFARSIANYRYHVQDAYYSDIIADVVGSMPSFMFAVLEKPPKNVVPDSGMMAFYQLTQDEKDAGRNAWQSDMAAIAFAMDTDEWSGYADTVIEIERPQWARNRDQ